MNHLKHKLDEATVSMQAMTGIKHLSLPELEAGLEHIRRSPKDQGVLELIVRRPRVEEREVLTVGELDLGQGLVGDSWSRRPSTRMPDRAPHPTCSSTS